MSVFMFWLGRVGFLALLYLFLFRLYHALLSDPLIRGVAGGSGGTKEKAKANDRARVEIEVR